MDKQTVSLILLQFWLDLLKRAIAADMVDDLVNLSVQKKVTMFSLMDTNRSNILWRCSVVLIGPVQITTK